MKSRIGRPKLKAKEKKEIFPLRLSEVELNAIKAAAGDEPLAKWMRRKLLGTTPEGELPKLSPQALQAANKVAVNDGMKRMAANLAAAKAKA
jgi:hypothetical protein